MAITALYAASLQAFVGPRVRHRVHVFSLTHDPATLVMTTDDAALAEALAACHRTFPIAAGWEQHSVSVVRIAPVPAAVDERRM